MEEVQQKTQPKFKPGYALLLAGALVIVLAGFYFLRPKTNTESGEMMADNTKTQEDMMDNMSDEMSENGSMMDGESMSDNMSEMMSDVIDVEGGMFYFKPNEIKVKLGEKVKIKLTSVEGTHDFVIDEFDVKSKMLNKGESDEFEFTADKEGTFEFYCAVSNHRQMGMVGKLIVEK